MKKVLATLGMAALTLGLCGILDARQLPTTISTDSDPLKDDAIVMVSPITKGKGNFLTNVLGKALNLAKTVKIDEVGFLFNALSMEAMQGVQGDPKSYHTKEVLPYLLKSKEVQDSLKLRLTARQIKYQTISEYLKKTDKLTDEQKKNILSFLSQMVGSPLIILDKSPLPSFMPQPGPCMIPIGVELLDAKTSARKALEISAICLLNIEADGEKIFSIKEALDNDTLDLVLCHENGHGIMVDMYGKGFAEIQRVSTNGHDAPYITDLGLAYIEGWAEAFEAVYGPANLKLKEKDRKKYNISEFLFGRQDPIRRDRYIWAKYFGKKTGIAKNGLQLMSTEGVIAGQFYDILTSRAINAPFEKCVTVMLVAQPQDYMQFIKNYLQIFPDDKKVLSRIVLEGMNYITMNHDAAALYHAQYQARVSYFQKKGSKEAFLKARNAFNAFKEDLFNKAMDGAELFANVGPQMWFSGVLKLDKKHSALNIKARIAKKLGQDTDVMPFNLDLNTVTTKMLVAIGVPLEDAEKLVAARATKGFFTGDPLTVLATSLGSEKYKTLQAACQLKNYSPQQAAVPDNQAKALWPEDVEKFNVVAE